MKSCDLNAFYELYNFCSFWGENSYSIKCKQSNFSQKIYIIDNFILSLINIFEKNNLLVIIFKNNVKLLSKNKIYKVYFKFSTALYPIKLLLS